MKKKLIILFTLLILSCAMHNAVRAQGMGTEQFPCYTCDSPTDPCTMCTDPNNPPFNMNPGPPPPPVDSNAPPPPPPLPTGPPACVVNPCSCNPQSCGIPPTPSSCQTDPCACNPATCAPYTGPTPNPPVPHASVTVTPSLSPAGSTMEYVTVTAPQGSIFSFGPLGIVFAYNPQTDLLLAAPGGGTSANPWNVTSYVSANFGGTYTQAEVINSGAPGIIAFTLVCQITISGSTQTQTVNVQYTPGSSTCTIIEN
jgi:hypothetical protein